MVNSFDAYLRIATRDRSYAAMLAGTKYQTWESLFALGTTSQSALKAVRILKTMIPLVAATIKNPVYFNLFQDQITLYNFRNVAVRFPKGVASQLALIAAQNERIHIIFIETSEELTRLFKNASSIEWLKLVRGDYKVLFCREIQSGYGSTQSATSEKVFFAIDNNAEFREIKAKYYEEERKERSREYVARMAYLHATGNWFKIREERASDPDLFD